MMDDGLRLFVVVPWGCFVAYSTGWREAAYQTGWREAAYQTGWREADEAAG